VLLFNESGSLCCVLHRHKKFLESCYRQEDFTRKRGLGSRGYLGAISPLCVYKIWILLLQPFRRYKKVSKNKPRSRGSALTLFDIICIFWVRAPRLLENTKFEVSSFSRFGDMRHHKQNHRQAETQTLPSDCILLPSPI